jgi:pseudouridine kinase
MTKLDDLSMRSGHVLAIGTSGLDVIAQVNSDLKDGVSNPARVQASYGGVARNVAENLARLGQPVSLVTVAGTDPTGEEMVSATHAAGVDVANIIRTSKYPTGFYMGLLNKKGRLITAIDDMRITTLLTPAALKKKANLFETASVLFLDMNLPEETVEMAFELARQAGLPVCADPTSASLSIKLVPYLPSLALIKPNVHEAGILTGREYPPSDLEASLAAARHMASLGVGVTLITMAEFGVCYATSETNGHIPAINTPITNSTGAGDALTATVLFGLLNGIPLDDAVRLGVSAATLTLRSQLTVNPDLSLEKLYDQLVV